jgi:hypothetical protein
MFVQWQTHLARDRQRSNRLELPFTATRPCPPPYPELEPAFATEWDSGAAFVRRRLNGLSVLIVQTRLNGYCGVDACGAAFIGVIANHSCVCSAQQRFPACLRWPCVSRSSNYFMRKT